MKADELDAHMLSGTPVLLSTERYGMVIATVAARKAQQVLLMATGQVRSCSAQMQKPAVVSRLQPQMLARQFLPPGAILQAKPYDVQPSGDDWGLNPNEVLLGILSQHDGGSQGIMGKTAIMVYSAAAEWFRRHMLGGSAFKRVHLGRLVWMTVRESSGSKAIKTDAAAVRSWMGLHRATPLDGRKLYAVPPSHDTGRLLASEPYRLAVADLLRVATPVNSKE